MQLQDYVSQFCAKNHIKKSEFAQSVGMTYKTLWNKLSGRRDFNIIEAARVSNALGIDMVEFVRLLFSTS